ncbi:hypothetical protein ASG29_01195 [Sphingomonas sp. Leaf412]|uniref:GGDEF domain-containing protein n=1 Tax=Sphingomonas sp. Leaf412 TaxID=1736370 RepID=UPI000701562E|nr:diguanylate cyclase [Sphingomonas sp. Leaf412]KQT34806.1 hypothetical protein ASG29_01195 [Sphingomonas sp. Leaf412]
MGIARFLNGLLLLLALLAARPAAAQNADIGVPVAICVARATDGDNVAAMLTARGRYDCTTPQHRMGPGDYWVRATGLPTEAGRSPRTIRSASLWQERATLYVAYADGAMTARTMDDRDATAALQIGAVLELPVPVRGVRATALLWRIEGAANTRGIVAQPRLATPDDSVRSNLLLGTLYAGFAGLCLALFVYNLALWAVLRHRFQLAYCAMLAALVGYAASSSGVLGWWTGMANTDRIRVNYLLLALAGVLAVAFARRFFEDRVFAGVLGRAARIVSGTLLASAVAFASLAPWHALALDQIYGAAFLALTIFAVAVLWRAWRMRSNQLWLFGIAWAAPIALAAMRVAAQFHLVRFSFLLDNSTLASMTVEALLSGIAISYRIRLLMGERDAAIAGEAAARALADTDPLTGLLNRRAFLREAIGEPERRRLVLADIDHFKRVNDTLGHDRGDEVLRRFARALEQAAPADALVARIGGEEFAILARDDHAGLADSVLTAVRAARMPYDLTVTASLGSEAGSIVTEADWSRLYRRADQALLAAKQAGRDRVRHAPPGLAA